MKNQIWAICVCTMCGALHATMPSVTDVSIVDNDGLLTVSYTLDIAAVITLDATTNGVPVDSAHVKSASGDVWKLVSAGRGTFTWRPANDVPFFNLASANLQMRVKAWDIDAPPDYMVVSLATNATVNVGVAYYENVAQLPGCITDPVYKTSKLVMRKIPAANVTWRMGSPSNETGRGTRADPETAHYVTLTEDFYIGVYPVTVAQWKYMDGAESSDMAACPVNTMSDLRGTSATDKRWPGDGHEISANGSRLAVIRAYTGIDFDLPTEAQWEFACRAGERAALYTGKELSNTTSCPETDEVAWYNAFSGTYKYPAYKEVGLKKPNAYGLYDMLGNAWELCLDRYTSDLGTASAIDPKGADTGDVFIKRGGAIDSLACQCRSSSRSHSNGWSDPYSPRNRNTGYRLWAAAQAVK